MKILVVFYSRTGNVFRLAEEVAHGAHDQGAEVRLRRVPDLHPNALSDQQPVLKAIPFASHEDLSWADGVCFGSPTRYGNMAAPLKAFIDQTGELWLKNALVGKVAGCFTSSSTQHGGQESTLLSMMIPLFHLGFVIQGLPYTHAGQMDMQGIHGGSPYGASSVSGSDSQRVPTAIDLELARALGRSVASTAGKLRSVQPLMGTERVTQTPHPHAPSPGLA